MGRQKLAKDEKPDKRKPTSFTYDQQNESDTKEKINHFLRGEKLSKGTFESMAVYFKAVNYTED